MHVSQFLKPPKGSQGDREGRDGAKGWGENPDRRKMTTRVREKCFEIMFGQNNGDAKEIQVVPNSAVV